MLPPPPPSSFPSLPPPCPSTSGVVADERARAKAIARRHRTVLIAIGFVSSIAISARALVHPGSEVRALLSTIGLVVVFVGLIAFAWGILQKRRADRLIDARLLATGALNSLFDGRPHGQICVQGAVICDSPLYSPVTNRPCLYYRVRRVAVFGTIERLIEERCFAAPFAIDDGSGRAWIDARNGGELEPLQSSRSQTTSPEGHVYRVEEQVLPLCRSLFVCGKISDEGVVAHVENPGRPLLAIEPPESGSMIISTRSRSHLLRETSKRAKVALAFSFVASVLGCTIATTGAPFQSADDEQQQQATRTASAPAIPVTTAEPPLAPTSEATAPPAATYEPPPPTTGVAPSPAAPPPPKHQRRRGSSAHR
jgi:hypothetical protein